MYVVDIDLPCTLGSQNSPGGPSGVQRHDKEMVGSQVVSEDPQKFSYFRWQGIKLFKD